MGSGEKQGENTMIAIVVFLFLVAALTVVSWILSSTFEAIVWFLAQSLWEKTKTIAVAITILVFSAIIFFGFGSADSGL